MKKRLKKGTRAAILLSIRKWRKIEESIHNIKGFPCPLCKLYYRDLECGNCPLDDTPDEYGCCCKEWRTVRSAIWKMIERLEKEQKKIKPRR